MPVDAQKELCRIINQNDTFDVHILYKHGGFCGSKLH